VQHLREENILLQITGKIFIFITAHDFAEKYFRQIAMAENG